MDDPDPYARAVDREAAIDATRLAMLRMAQDDALPEAAILDGVLAAALGLLAERRGAECAARICDAAAARLRGVQ